MISPYNVKCVVSGFCYGISAASFAAGIVCNAGLISNAGIAEGTNLMVNSIIFYCLPDVMTRLVNGFPSCVNSCKTSAPAPVVVNVAPAKKMKKTSSKKTVRMKKSSKKK
jgi:hypothetical protein